MPRYLACGNVIALLARGVGLLVALAALQGRHAIVINATFPAGRGFFYRMARGLERLEFGVCRFYRLCLRVLDAFCLGCLFGGRSRGSPFGSLGMRGLRLGDLLGRERAVRLGFSRRVYLGFLGEAFGLLCLGRRLFSAALCFRFFLRSASFASNFCSAAAFARSRQDAPFSAALAFAAASAALRL